VEVALSGSFDYSSTSRQAQEVIEGVKLKYSGLVCRLDNPSKGKILDIYKKSLEKEAEHAGGNEPAIPKKIFFRKAEWYLENETDVELRPSEVNVSYCGKEPDYISKMRKELAGTRVRVGININK
jgi:hypothetical protein